MPNYYVGGILASSNDLFHYGVVGMKWGIRRYQNPDGSYTSAGKKRYKTFSQLKKDYPGLDYRPTYPKTDRPGGLTDQELDDAFKKYEEDPRYKILAESSERLDKKVHEDIGDWYNSDWKNGKIAKMAEVKYKKIEELDEKFNSRQISQELENIEKKYEDKAVALLPNIKRGSKKDRDKIERYVKDMSYAMAMLDPKHIQLEKQQSESWNKINKETEKIRSEYETKMLGEILKSLGYQNTKEARAYIYSTILWD